MELIDQARFDAAWNKEKVGHPGDCERICRVASEKMGITMALHQAEHIWDEWSEMMAAGWIFIEDDYEIVNAIESFVRRQEKESNDT